MLTVTNTKPPDIAGCHIFAHAYADRVRTFFNRLPPELISGQWKAENWERSCTDKGPGNDCEHGYTGYHQICSLNNMIPLRSDVRSLFDS